MKEIDHHGGSSANTVWSHKVSLTCINISSMWKTFNASPQVHFSYFNFWSMTSQLVFSLKRKSTFNPPCCLFSLSELAGGRDSGKDKNTHDGLGAGVCVRVGVRLCLCGLAAVLRPVITCHSGHYYSQQRRTLRLSDTERKVICQTETCVSVSACSMSVCVLSTPGWIVFMCAICYMCFYKGSADISLPILLADILIYWY